jgi:hypothetical protein
VVDVFMLTNIFFIKDSYDETMGADNAMCSFMYNMPCGGCRDEFRAK